MTIHNNTEGKGSGRGAERREARRRAKLRAKRLRVAAVILGAAITTICAVWFAVKIISRQSDVSAFKREQDSLNAFDREHLEINPDYVGWLKINGTNIDYPVVRGANNEKYLDTTFYGEKNVIGALFMDYRVGEGAPHVIIYGHDVHHEKGDRFQFGGLDKYLDSSYLAKHSIIMYVERDSLHEFEIFSARLTDINDPAYRLDFSEPGSFNEFLKRNGAPFYARRVITLSTCVGAYNDSRMIVQGALRRTVAVTAEHKESGWKIIMRS